MEHGVQGAGAGKGLKLAAEDGRSQVLKSLHSRTEKIGLYAKGDGKLFQRF